MKRTALLVLPVLLLVGALTNSFTGRVPVSGPVYNIVDFGAIGNGNLASATANTTAINAAWAAAASPANPGTVYIPPSAGGFVVNNGSINVTAQNVSIHGNASMGSNLNNGPTSAIIGHGPGSTITISGGGGSVSGIEFRPSVAGEQTGGASFLRITGTAVSIKDLHIWSPNIGISLQLPIAAEGEFWISNVLVEGQISTSGIEANAGNAAVKISHVIMFSSDLNPPNQIQPPYGIVVTSCGELVMTGGCDIIQCGTCLGIVPGLGGVKGQHTNALFVSDCLFDSPNGNGVYIGPKTDGFASLVKFTNCWASTANNNQGKWPANGWTLDGSQSTPPTGIRPITDVNLVNCNSRSFVNHCGLFAKNVYGLTITSSTFTGNFKGIQTYGCVGILSNNKCGDYSPPPNGYAPGNADCGIQLEKSQMVFNPGDHLLSGNGIPFRIIP